MAALYLLASSPVAAQQYKMVPLSDKSGIQVDRMTQSSTATLTKATVTADLSACLGSLGGFAILGFSGPPNTTVVFKVTQTASGILGFSNSSTGPFTDTIDILVPLDATGNGESDPFYLKGVGLGQTVVSICSDQLRCVWNQVSSIVVNVAGVEWEAVNGPLDNNPNAGGGLRMFPGKATATDTDKTTVMIKVALSSEFAGKEVYVKAFDVDDPSTDNTVVDRDGSGGVDNNGTTPSINQTTGIGIGTGVTGSDGVARFTFQVSKQPGDNFRIAGACILGDRDGLTVNGVGVKDGLGQALPTDRAKISPILTVWRRVHIEVDSMGAISGNEVTGVIKRASKNTSFSFDATNLFIQGGLTDGGRFELGSRIVIDGVSYPVAEGDKKSVTVAGTIDPKLVKGKSFVLYDDDDIGDNNDSMVDGDQGEQVPTPDTSMLQDSDDPTKNIFAAAYVRPIYDLTGNQNDVPFVANMPDDSSSFLPIYRFQAQQPDTELSYWTVYLLGAYQPAIAHDNDPVEDAYLGEVDSIRGVGANVFSELLTDHEGLVTQTSSPAVVAAHEIGHLFGGQHTDGGIMTTGNSDLTFSPTTLNAIRMTNRP